jgi:hypothetical protein
LAVRKQVPSFRYHAEGRRCAAARPPLFTIMTDDKRTPRKVGPTLIISGLHNATMGDFWAWAYSDLVSNTVRPLFAEYLVGESLNLTREPRVEWDSVDFRYRDRCIEVKSAGYVQAWAQRKPSVISFDISARKKPWDAATNTFLSAGRCAHLFVFCVHTDQSRDRCCVHDTDRWDFYVLTTRQIADSFGDQRSVRLNRILARFCAVKYSDLRRKIDTVIDEIEKIS